MNSYIPKQPRHERERVEAKLDARLVRRLEKYCQYIESDRDYVIAQALEIIFRKDRGFAEWMDHQGSLDSAEQFPSKSGRQARASAELPVAGETHLPDPSGRRMA